MDPQRPDHPGDASLEQSPAGDQDLRLAALESQVAAAQAELEDYQRLLHELPGIYEGKFRQKLRSVAQEIRQLLDERTALQGQIAQALAKEPVPEAFSAANQVEPPRVPPPISGSSTPSRQGVKTWAGLRLPRLSVPSPVLTALALKPQRRWVWAGSLGLLVMVLGAAAAVPWLLGRQGGPTGAVADTGSSPRSQTPVAPLTLQLEARGGESWVLVEDLQGRLVFNALMLPGAPKRLPMGSGLRLRSGRPDLLFVALGGEAPKPLGAIGDLDWVEMMP